MPSRSSAVRRRSLSAERAIQSRKRYRIARNPNFSATATGSSTRLLELEGRPGGAELDHVARLERLRAVRVELAAVDLHAVRRAQVAHDPRAARRPHLGVLARDVGVVEDDVGITRAAERRAAGAEQLRPAG